MVSSSESTVFVPPNVKSLAIDRIIVGLGGTANLDRTHLTEHLQVASSILGEQVTLADVDNRIARCAKWQEQLVRLLKSPGITQRTPEWYAARMQLITASDVAQALGCSKFGNRRQFFQKKCGLPEEQVPFNASIPPLKWGVMYEAVAQSIYTAINAGMGVYEFGLLRHQTVPHLGASPDGISEMGVMLEIKCPWKRRIQEGSIPLQYYYQMQMQLEVCDLDECDFFECEFVEVGSPGDEVWASEPNPVFRGMFAEVVVKDKECSYLYPPGDGVMTPGCYSRWLAGVETATSVVGNGAAFVRPHWWVLRKSSTVRVIRDSNFVIETIEKTLDAWNDVIRYRGDREAYLAEIGVTGSPDPKPKSSRALKSTASAAAAAAAAAAASAAEAEAEAAAAAAAAATTVASASKCAGDVYAGDSE